MKNLLIYTLTALSFFLFSFTKGGYETAMENAITEMNQAKDLENLKSVANKFERIGATESKKWLPSYYQAYCFIMMTTRESDVTKWDGFLDRADALLDQSQKIKKANMVEILTLKGFSAMMRISVDPSVRGQEYSMKSAGFLQQAYQLDNKNPRANLMMAQMLFGTAQFFGSSTDEACQKLKDTKNLFEKEEEEGSGILPVWGKPQAEKMLNKCSATSTQDN
ncbi:MAG: hypothetical protein L3J29_11050 [Cyclobacteriaceae bacterium]|nr:hypothetical protein [Cyclobacteriaceae bacterium]